MPGWDSRRSRQIFSDGRPAQPPNRAATVVLANQPNMRTAHRLIKVARPSAEAWALERPSPKGPNPRGNRRQGDSTPGRARWVVPVACWIPSLSQPEGGHFSAIACPGRAPVGLASGDPAPVLAARVHAGAVPRPPSWAGSILVLPPALQPGSSSPEVPARAGPPAPNGRFSRCPSAQFR